jgi:hypothetical protein
MTYLGLSAAKQISRALTAGEISDVVSNPKEFNSGWTSAEAIPTKVENREAVCLVAELPASGR